MKKYIVSIVMACVTIFTIVASPATQSNAKLEDGVTLLEGPTLQRSGITRASEPGPLVGPRTTIVSFWTTGPTKADPKFFEFATGVARGVVNGESPASRIVGFALLARNLTTSMEEIPWNVIVVMPRKGEKVRLSDLVTKVTCRQDANLNETQLFGEAAYAPTAIGVLNGEFVTSGPATQEVDFFVVLVATKTYTASFEEVRKWVEVANSRFDITMKTCIAGVSAMSTISSVGYDVALYPRLVIGSQGSSVLIGHPLGNSGRSYVVTGMDNLVSTKKEFIGNVTGNEQIMLTADGGMRFFQSIGL